MLKKIPKLGKILAVAGLSVVLLATTLLSQNNDLKDAKGSARETVAARSIANPNFTIQHYFYFEDINIYKNVTGNEYVKILNTDNGGQNKGGNIPNNGETEDISYIKLVKSGDRYVPETSQKLTKLFLDEETDFKHNPTITYMDRLWNASGEYNPNYTLKEVWILKPGKSKESVNQADFIVYPVPSLANGRHNPDAINFTNNPANPHITKVEGDTATPADEYTILIQNDDVIRLVFNTVATNDYHKTGVDFYDYDLSDGKIYTTASKTNPVATSKQDSYNTFYMNTYQSGINSNANYGTSGVKYAFGNSNAGTGLGDLTWSNNGKNNTLNKANKTINAATMLTYDIVKGFNEDGSLIWNTGINGPKIFGPATAVGKTSFRNDQFSLLFKRRGGTFTLSGLKYGEETKINNLDSFKLRTFYGGKTYIYSNDFWPMDYAPTYGADGHDAKFGAVGDGANYLNTAGTARGGDMPQSDDETNHNGYFGMSYTTEFTLDPGYDSPLDFFFFGDDDLWLFLTKPDGTQTLIADIGGLHSSLGTYVNLWDYIEPIPYLNEKGEENTASDTYKLTFFYTERGAAGSTCYMRFTVPLDAVTKESPTIRQLQVEKAVEGEEETPGQEHQFKISFYNTIRDIYDIYDYAIFRADGTPLTGNLTIASGEILTLHAGEYAIIDGISDGVNYRVQEIDSTATTTSYQEGTSSALGTSSTLGESKVGKEATGSMKDKNYVKFTNSYAALSVEKEVIGVLGDKVNKEFTFTITLGDNTFTGTRSGINFTNGVGTIQLKSGEKKVISGLPVTTYQVTESDSDDYVSVATSNTGSLVAGETKTVKFTNYKTKDLKIAKEVSGEALSNSLEYQFTISLSGISHDAYPKSYQYQKYDSSNEPVGDPVSISDSATFTLKKGEYIIIKNLPDAAQYTIVETSNEASKITYYQGTESTIEEATETEGETVHGSVATDDYVKYVNYFDDLVVRKTVLGSGDKNKYFTFTVKLENEDITGDYGDMHFNHGVATFKLKHNGVAKAIGLPDGVRYTVTESDNEGYHVYATNQTGVLADGRNVSSTFTNYITKTLRIEKQAIYSKDEEENYAFLVEFQRPNSALEDGVYDYTIYKDEREVSNGTISSGQTIHLKSGEYIEIKEIPDTVSYTITETTSNFNKVTYSQGTIGQSLSGKDTEGSVVKGTLSTSNYVKIMNTYARLTVSKKVVGATGDRTKQFSFGIQLDDSSVTGTYGGVVFANGIGTFTLKDGQTVTIDGLPETNYTITESNGDYVVTHTGDTGTLVSGDVKEAVFTNFLTKKLKIEKQVTLGTGIEDLDYTFEMNFTFPDNNDYQTNYRYQKYDQEHQPVGDASNIASGGTFTLKAGESIEIEGLPDNTQYTITETDSQTASKTLTKKGVIDTGLSGNSVETKTVNGELNTQDYVQFTNIYTAIEVEKTVLGNANKNQLFTFTVTLEDSTFNGVRDGVTFTNGVGTFQLKHGEKKVLEGLPTTTYTVEESDFEDYVSVGKNNHGTTVSGQTQKVSFMNYQTKDLKIEKEVDGTEPAEHTDYTFQIEWSNIENDVYPKTYTYEKHNQDGTTTSGEILSTGGTIFMKNKEYVVIKGLPDETTYTITETDVNASKVTYYLGTIKDGLEDSEEQESATVTASLNHQDYVKYINYFDGLVVRKTVLGSGDKNQYFTFTVKLENEDITGDYGDMYFEHGVATFKLKHNERKVATMLPENTIYTVTESDNEGYEVYSSNAHGEVATGKNVTISFINYKTNDLKIEKKVVGKRKDETAYEFNIRLVKTNPAINDGKYHYVKYNSAQEQLQEGEIQDNEDFTLKDGEYIVLEDLSDDVKYTITEKTDERQQVNYYQGTITGGLTDVKNDGRVATGTVSNSNYVQFVNSYAALTIHKDVIGVMADKTKSFTFGITLTDLSISGTYGDVTFINGIATFSLKNGESITIDGLPEVGYTIVETDYDDYVVRKTNDTGTLVAGETIQSIFRNYQTTSLKVEKEVVGLSSNTEEYRFVLHLRFPKENQYDEEYSYQKYNQKGTVGESGMISSGDEFTLKAGEYILIENISDEVTYEVEEIPNHVSKVTYQEGTISENLSSKEFEGTSVSHTLYEKNYIRFINSYATVTVSKTVIGELGDVTKEFTFTMTLSDSNINGQYGDVNFVDGVGTFTLAHGQVKTVIGLPDQVSYVVEESDNEGYTVVKHGNEGVVKAGEKKEVRFTNFITKNLIIEKDIEGTDPIDSHEYSFEITFTHLDNPDYSHSYYYKKYHIGDDQEVLETGIFTDFSEFTLEAGEYIIVENLPDAVEYTITETSTASKTTYYMDSLPDEVVGTEVTGNIDVDNYVRFTNFYAGLSVQKQVIGKTDAKNKEFTFTVTLEDTSITGDYGDMSFKEGVATFTLKDGETKYAFGLPDNIGYTVVESPLETYASHGEHTAGTTVAGMTQEVEFTNYLLKDLKIQKIVKGIAPQEDMEYTFTLELSNLESELYPKTFQYQKYNKEGEPIGEKTEIRSGDSFTLKDGEYIIVENLPDDAIYVVYEELLETGNGKVSYQQEDFIIDGNRVVGEVAYKDSVIFYNQYASITVGVVVEGSDANKNKEFHFQVKTNNPTLNGWYGDMFFENGVSKFDMKHGESKSAVGLPDGLEYTVEESDTKGYTVSKQSDKTTTEVGDDQQTLFVNERNIQGSVSSPETGDNSHPGIWSFIWILSILCISCGLRKTT